MRLLALAAAVLAVTVSAAPAATKPHWTWRSLHRPLHVPRIEPGASCPVSSKTTVDLGREGNRELLGRGPAYPDLGGGKSVLEFWYPPLPQQTDFYGTGWSGNKVLWWVSGRYHGPVLIRGRQLDGPHLLRFDRGNPPPTEMRIRPGRGYKQWKGARARASYTRVEAPGCYGYQIDGVGFSRVIVFEARVVAPPRSLAAARPPTWRSLHRRLRIPEIAPGSACPTSKPDPRGDLSRFPGFVGTAWGRGPAYPGGLGSGDKPVMHFAYPPRPESLWAGSEWSGQKVLWIVAPSYVGRILVRGRQLDGPNELRFGNGMVPSRELHVIGRGPRTGQPSFTRLRAPGCYGWQIDGKGFSRVIVFEAQVG